MDRSLGGSGAWPTRLARWLCAIALMAALAGCGGASGSGGPAAARAVGAAASPASSDTLASCLRAGEGPESTRSLDPNTVLCAFTAGDGRQIRLTAGRSSRGRERGDWGWAHIRDKHVYGLWEAGGQNTRYAEVGATTERDVLALIQRALADPTPEQQADGARIYRSPVIQNGYRVMVVVGDTGRIITAYPVREARR